MAVLMKKRFSVLLILMFVSSNFARAETPAWDSVKSEFSSPWTTNAKYIFWGGMGLAIFLKQATPDFVESMQRTWNQDKSFGEYSKYGDYFGQGIPNVIYFLGMWSHFYFTNEQKSKDRSIMMFKTGFYSSVLTHSLKLAWQMPRPDNYNQKDSFPSGHTTAAFAFASTIWAEHGVYWGTAAYLGATYAGLSRINDNRHRINDVIAGASIGMSYGIGLYSLANSNPGSKDEGNKSVFLVLPADDLDGVVIQFATQL